MAGTDNCLLSTKRTDIFWEGEERLLFNNIQCEPSAGSFHRESAEQQRLSKMDTNMLSSHCDRSITGEQLSKMNSISNVSQYKCLKPRRTWASSSPFPSSEVSKRELASKRSSGSRKALSTRTTTLGKTLLSHARSATLWDYTLSNTYVLTVAPSSCLAAERKFQRSYRQWMIHLFVYANLKLRHNIIAFFFLLQTNERAYKA